MNEKAHVFVRRDHGSQVRVSSRAPHHEPSWEVGEGHRVSRPESRRPGARPGTTCGNVPPVPDPGHADHALLVVIIGFFDALHANNRILYVTQIHETID